MRRRPDQQLLFASVIALGLAGALVRFVPGFGALSSALEQALVPVEQGLSGAASWLRDTADRDRDAASLQAELDAALVQIEELQIQMLQFEDFRRENRQIRQELNFAKNRPDLDLAGTSVIGNAVATESGPVVRAIKLDAGREQGVEARLTVVNHLGLIGQVATASETWCQVMLITHPKSRVAARVDRTGKTGVVVGTPTGELIMRYIPQDLEDSAPNVQVGDIVETSGMSQVFPPHLTIGQVIEVRQSDVAKWQEAVVRPTVDFSALEVALVVMDWVPLPESELVDELFLSAPDTDIDLGADADAAGGPEGAAEDANRP